MRRPSRGKNFEEALKRWSSPDDYVAYIELEDEAARDFRIKDAVRRSSAIRDEREALEDALFKRLHEGELLSSAVGDPDAPRPPRHLVHPATYRADLVRYLPREECVDASGTHLYRVEIFVPERIPTNVKKLPDWLPQFACVHRSTPRPLARGVETFRHDRSYRHVWIGDREFLLTEKQAAIVRALHESALADSPWMEVGDLRQEVGFESAKLSHLFRRMPDWRDLIYSDGRGHYRLNL